jgi:hypothetical protein
MTALAALRTFPTEDHEPRARIAKDSGSFHDEIEQAKREPAKKVDKPKEKRPRDDEPEATTAEAPVEKTIAVKREVADIALAVKFSPASKVGGHELDAMIQQSATVATQQVARAATDAAVLPPMSPLEQAVHDLIDQLRDRHDDPEPGPEAVTADVVPVAPPVFAPVEDRDVAAPVPVAAVLEADAELAQPLNPSHVHLVIDEAERLVVTVAVRGDSVIAHIRGGDDATAASLARNAATLDTAMRARGLQLTDFQASRDGSSDTHKDEPQRERQPDQTKQPKFILEKTP